MKSLKDIPLIEPQPIMLRSLNDFLGSFPPEYRKKYMEKVPLPRLVSPLDWKTRLLIAARKFPSGFAGGFCLTFLGALELSGTAAFSLVGLARAVVGGVIGGLGLTGAKAVKEVHKDAVLKPARVAMEAVGKVEDKGVLKVVETVMSVALTVGRLYGLRVDEALREVAIVLGSTAELPREAHELLQVVARTLSEDSEGGAVITADEALEIIKEAKDVKEAAGKLLSRLK